MSCRVQPTEKTDLAVACSLAPPAAPTKAPFICFLAPSPLLSFTFSPSLNLFPLTFSVLIVIGHNLELEFFLLSTIFVEYSFMFLAVNF